MRPLAEKPRIRPPLRHGFYPGTQPAFAAGGLVFMDNAFVDCGIDDGLGGFECRLGLFFIAGTDGGDHFFDESAEVAALSDIPHPAFFCLSCAFLSLSCIGHNVLKGKVWLSFKQPYIFITNAIIVNDF